MEQKKAIAQLNKIKKFADKTNMRLAAEDWDAEWKIIISTIMSAQTKDETTIDVAEKLFKKYPTARALGLAKQEDVEAIVRRVNYYKTKAKNIRACALTIADEGIRYNIDELVKLPGVGRKTANVFLTEVNKIHAIAVDTHVFRISRKLGWAKGNTPEKVEKELYELFPKKYWKVINPTLVRFGKGYGTSRKREDEILEEIKENSSISFL